MNYRNKLGYFLVKQANISHKEAARLISEGRVWVDEIQVFENAFLNAYSKVVLNGQVLSKAHTLQYVALYKPKGIECTMNENIKDNLTGILPAELRELFYTGRLDKASEGLLLLTNDGHLVNKIIAPEAHLAKTYLVGLEKPFDDAFIKQMESGVMVLNKMTLPCTIVAVSDTHFTIVLTQGMNRQIRRMCFALGNYVVYLKRIAIGAISLNDLKPGEYRNLTGAEVSYLQNL